MLDFLRDAKYIKTDRALLELSGSDMFEFLQPLITNDVYKLRTDKILYTLLLTPQGRILHDFFLIYDEEKQTILIEIDAEKVLDLTKILLRYKLHSKISITDVSSDYQFLLFLYSTEKSFIKYKNSYHYPDSRSENLGGRLILHKDDQGLMDNWQEIPLEQYENLRIQNLIPNSTDLEYKAFPLEFRLDEINALSFDKGCFIGQEVTALMRNRKSYKRKTFYLKSTQNLPNFGEEIIYNKDMIGIMLSKINDNEGLVLIKITELDKLECFNNCITIV